MASIRSLATRTVSTRAIATLAHQRLLPAAHTLQRLPQIKCSSVLSQSRRFASDIEFGNSGKSAPQQAQESMSLGVDALAQGNTQQALDHFSHALTLSPTADAHYNIGICHYTLGSVDKALEHWEQALVLDPNQADAHVNAGNVYFMNKKDAQSAIRHMVKAVELAPKDGEIQFNLGCMYEATGQLESAIKMYDRAASNGLEKARTHMRNTMAKQMRKKL
ncbi:TPR-like protein [Martensiomyces pterosporus]|nr:TPR-like protein [Martensiomyces pterosporus]